MGINPAVLIPQNIENFQRQLRRIGGMFDWRHELSTTDPDYYKWTQWIFLQLLKAGKAYKKAAAVNWCPKDKTVLANEQVIDGRCERCGTVVEQRILEQWFFRITEYADRLLDNLDHLDWSDSTRTAQRNWLGRSEGAEIEFSIDAKDGKDGKDGTSPSCVLSSSPSSPPSIRVFTTRPDTLYGATFMVLAPEHPLVDRLASPVQKAAVDEYRKAVASRTWSRARWATGRRAASSPAAFAKNPANGRMIPIWIADYVLMEYGTGAIMAVPGHDERDFEFARKYGLPIVRVVGEPGQPADTLLEAAYTDNEQGRLVNSGHSRRPDGARGQARDHPAAGVAGAGKGVVQYRLHDWCISRQRYWGPPIPVIYCDEHGAVPVPEKDLPVVLPMIEDFRPDDTGIAPLARHEEWYYVPCPACGKRSRRETDVSDTFLDSAWYFLRYPYTEFGDRPFDKRRTETWLPVHTYIGGNEHAVLHLLYSRFVTMVLHELGHARVRGAVPEVPGARDDREGRREDVEVARQRRGAGRVHRPLGRRYLPAVPDVPGPVPGGRRLPRRGDQRAAAVPGQGLGAGGRGVPHARGRRGAARDPGQVPPDGEAGHRGDGGAALQHQHRGADGAGERAPAGQLHPATLVEGLIVMLAPFAPHFAEESWERLGHGTSVFEAKWPGWNEALPVEDQVEVVVQVGGKTRSKVSVPRDALEEDVVAAAQRDAAVKRFVEGKSVTKVVYVKNRLLNLVVGS